MYHLQLRQFPHNLCRFNLDAPELWATVLTPWAADRWIELGERKWSPHQATLTVLEGPLISLDRLTMSRGWRTAQREGRDVTAELLEAARRELARAADERPAALTRASPGPAVARAAGTSAPGGDAAAAGAADLVADSLGLELLAQLGTQRAPLRRAWELAHARSPGAPVSASLAIAERAVMALVRAGLVVLLAADAAAEDTPPIVEPEAEGVLAAIESWLGEGAPVSVWIQRA